MALLSHEVRTYWVINRDARVRFVTLVLLIDCGVMRVYPFFISREGALSYSAGVPLRVFFIQSSAGSREKRAEENTFSFKPNYDDFSTLK